MGYAIKSADIAHFLLIQKLSVWDSRRVMRQILMFGSLDLLTYYSQKHPEVAKSVLLDSGYLSNISNPSTAEFILKYSNPLLMEEIALSWVKGFGSGYQSEIVRAMVKNPAYSKFVREQVEFGWLNPERIDPRKPIYKQFQEYIQRIGLDPTYYIGDPRIAQSPEVANYLLTYKTPK